MRLLVLVALLLVVTGCYFMLDSARDLADDVAMTTGKRSAADATPLVLNPYSVPYTRGFAALTVRCEAERACDGTATLRSRAGAVHGTVEYYLRPGQPAQLMIPARRPGEALVRWRSRNGVESQTELTLQR
jgi:hypothetical protein